MKLLNLVFIATTLTSAVYTSSAIAQRGPNAYNTVIEDEVLIGLSIEEAGDLAFMREEEKLAHDVYVTLYAQWGLDVFNNIADSEATHTETVKALLDKYGLIDPALDDIGAFVNTDLQALYNQLVSRGMTSSMEALHVGALIEEVDMVDLKHAIENTTHDDIVLVYENLLKGSRNHLRSYVDTIESYGVVYEAQYLTQEEVDAIVDSPMERGTVSH